MFSHYFGFEENPFGATPDPRYLYAGSTHREALASLRYGFLSNRGFTALIAPPGLGKTTLLFEFLRQVRKDARTAFLFNSQFESIDLLKSLLREVGVTPREGLGEVLDQLNHELVETARGKRRFVVVVDEAQNLTDDALETLRMLTNFETTRTKLMQIVLSGQPQLAERLRSVPLMQLRQRISTFCQLKPLPREDTIAYIAHRLKIAGYTGSTLFTSEALDRIAEASGGVPRNINTLCFNALSLGWALKRKRIDATIVAEAIDDLQLPSSVQQPPGCAEERGLWHIQPLPATQSWVSRARVFIFALLLVFGIAIALWAIQLFDLERIQAKPTRAVAAPQVEPTREAPPRLPDISAPPAGENPIQVTVVAEQTISGIAMSRLGGFDDELLRQIKELNPGMRNPDLIYPGQTLLLPSRLAQHPDEHVAAAPRLR